MKKVKGQDEEMSFLREFYHRVWGEKLIPKEEYALELGAGSDLRLFREFLGLNFKRVDINDVSL